MRKLLLIIILITLIASPGLANSETIFTGGGIIKEGNGPGACKITFAVNIFTDESGVPSTGGFQINFHNTHYDYLGNDYFDKGKFKASEITGGIIETRYFEYPADSGMLYDYTFVRIEAIGQFNNVDDWVTVTRFSDFGEPGDGILADAVRIMIFDPDGNLAYDTATDAGEGLYDYPREQGWRTLLDGGNIAVFYQD